MKKLGKNFWDASVTLTPGAKRFHSKEEIIYPYQKYLLDLTIFVSCYNEELFIEDTLTTIVEAMKIVQKSYEIIVIDDGSKDKSITIVHDFMEKNPEINIILRQNKINKGLAQNYIDGAFLGRGKYYRLICGDNAEPVDTLVKVFSMLGEADILIPYYESAEGRSFYRLALSKFFTSIINVVSGNKLYYYNGLHVHLRYNILRWHPNTKGFGFQADILCTLLSLGFTYKQIPCVSIEKRQGKSNAVSLKNFMSVNRTILSIFLRRLAPWT